MTEEDNSPLNPDLNNDSKISTSEVVIFVIKALFILAVIFGSGYGLKEGWWSPEDLAVVGGAGWGGSRIFDAGRKALGR